MISLIQHKVANSSIFGAYSKIEENKLTMNVDLINKDLERLKGYLNDTKSTYDKNNIKALIKYLEKLLKNIEDDSTFEMCWNFSNKEELPCSYPLSLINEKAYGINTCNYIEINENEKLIEFDMQDLADIIAFDFMYKDLGESHDTIEDLLKDCGIVGYESADVLLNYFKSTGDNMYKLSKTMKMEDTPYYSFETKRISDYFHSTEFKGNSYKDVVEYSCKYANSIIANAIIKRCKHFSLNGKLLMLNATNIAIMVTMSEEINVRKEILDDISIRVFGRHFLIEPKISVF